MKYKCVAFEQKDGVGMIMLNRPHMGNRINGQLAQELMDVCTQVQSSDQLRVIIITGTGEQSFCLGSESDLERIFQDNLSAKPCPITEAIAALKMPVIAAINGDAFEMGLEIALACDIRIAAEGARFSLPQIRHGTIPWCGGTQRLPRIVGKAKALEMILTGEVLDATEALHWGLISRVVPAQKLPDVTLELARDIASKAAIATSFAKEAICSGVELTLSQGLRLESDLYFLLHTTEDRQEGIRAFLEKRRPCFRSR